ncbi:MAG: hypothetical protein ACTHOB_11170 [Ginsengibacter sp.]
MVYIPYGLLCIAVTIVIINSFKKVRENKKTNRSVRNSDRLQTTLSMLQARKQREKEKEQNDEFS